MLKRIISGVMAIAMLAGTVNLHMAAPEKVTAAENPNFNYADVLQKTIYFYECQQAGHLPEWNRVEWKTDSNVIDEIDGGWYDAGDHVKFNLPMAYSAALLAWGLYQYPDGLEESGEMTNYVNNLKFVMDYFAACDKGTSAVYQVGNGQKDHTWWGPVELYQYGMEDAGTNYAEARATLEASEGCSAVFGGMAAALAAGAAALKGRVDDADISSYIKHSENLFKLADASKSDDVYNTSDAMGFYRSSHFYDELFYAANWLYIATGDKAYLDKATSYIPHLDTELGSDELKYTWAHCWDDAMQGGMLLYAINTQDSTYIERVRKHVAYWTNDVKELPGGLRWIATWGCARYATAAAFIAGVACDTVLKDQDTSKYEEFAETQVNYCLGDNPNDISLVVGFGDKYPLNPHHRTAHASWKNDLAIPDNNRHILYGALVGGPNEDGTYEDDRQNYINNEVTTDYNAGITAMLCRMVQKYGGKSDPNFPPKETHDGPEFYVETTVKGMTDQGATLSFKITNHSAWPARVQDNIGFRYYMDLSEIPEELRDKVELRCDRDQASTYSGVKPAQISPVTQYDGSIYYVEVTLPDGKAVLPVSEGMQQCEILLAFVYPNYGTGWDAENDFSNKELMGTEDPVISPYVPTYVDGKLYYGIEPDGTSANGDTAPSPDKPKPKPTEPTPTETAPPEETKTGSSEESVIYGDCNTDGNVTVSDVILLVKTILGADSLSEQGKKNADVDLNGNITTDDSNFILKSLAQICTLPIT